MNIENSTYEISKLIHKYKNNSDGNSNEKTILEQICESYGVPYQLILSKSSITELCEEAFNTAKSKGWHDKARSFGEAIALIHAEASEALEADRRNEGRERVAEELADICIRVFDASMEFGLDLETAIRTKMEYNKTRTYKHGNKAY
jgi:NTP pyrophosphatase (non-canonical NTP hydrolase)